MPAHRVYVEPFGGAASVLLRKARSYAEVYNDLDDDVVNLFQVLRGPDAEKLAELLRLTPFAKSEFERAYEASDLPLERARRLIIRSFMGFGSNSHQKRSGFRSNSNRSGSTPAHDWLRYPNQLAAIIERLRGVVISKRDAWAVMSTHDSKQTLHFIDPPYVPSTRDSGADYAHELTLSDHETLLNNIQTLDGMVVLSGYDNDLYSDMLGGWHRVERAALADGARPRTEVLWMNFEQQKDLLSA